MCEMAETDIDYIHWCHVAIALRVHSCHGGMNFWPVSKRTHCSNSTEYLFLKNTYKVYAYVRERVCVCVCVCGIHAFYGLFI